MTLAAGTRLGSYEILALLGAGGMGEVYRARDTRVDREVALKVLPEEFFEDEERRARFGREARTLASQNHTGIAVLYPSYLGSSPLHTPPARDGARRRRGPRPASRVRSTFTGRISLLRPPDRRGYGRGARKGDRSPGPQTRERQGEARREGEGPGLRAREDLEGEAGGSGLAPVGAARTRPPSPRARGGAGVILGTAAYMRPEQARGKPVDQRTDSGRSAPALGDAGRAGRLFSGGDSVSGDAGRSAERPRSPSASCRLKSPARSARGC